MPPAVLVPGGAQPGPWPGDGTTGHPAAGGPWAGFPAASQPLPLWYPNNGFGTAALVVGVVAVLLSPSIVFGALLGVLAIGLGAAGRARVRHGTASNRGSATAGIALGGAGLLLSAGVLAFVALSLSGGTSLPTGPPDEDPGTYHATATHPHPPVPGGFGRASIRQR
ncbi:DUF4190 domain-containing protein [Streptomyces sp. NPDC059740]|uniref:DUF4190 domain-containing protein n=1 Tax=Streptomyces sp. NPDC059740 TaxID=3346926 RepID=UPI00364EF1F8